MKHARKILALLLCVVMTLGMLPTSAIATGTNGLENFKKVNTYADGMFSDVSSTDWYYENIKTAYEFGLMIGRGEDFGANSNVTVAETVTLAARIHSIYSGRGENFEKGTPWYKPYVDYVTSNKLVDLNGLEMTKPATRAQFSHILGSALPDKALKSINNVADDAIPDVKVGDTYASDIYRLYRAGILTGIDDNGTCAPDRSIERSEVSAIVTRMADTSLRRTITLGDFHTVTLNLNYNKADADQTIAVENGKTVSAPSNPRRSGYVFIGWYTQKSGGSKFDFTTAITEDLTLYAHWRISSSSGSGGGGGYVPPSTTYYTVTFNSNGGDNVASQRISSGGTVTRPADPTRTGYTFVGWYDGSDLVHLYDFTSVVTSNIILYARWELVGEEVSTFLDETDPEVEIYSFDINTRSIPIGEAKDVTFFAEIFTNTELDDADVSILDKTGAFVGYMYDDGLPVHGDEKANDGIYSCKTTLSSNTEKYDEYCAVTKDARSGFLGIGYYTPFSDAELAQMQVVNDSISTLVSNSSFTDASDEEKRLMLEEQLSELQTGGQIENFSYDESSRAFTYEYASGVQGIFELPTSTDADGVPLNGSASPVSISQDIFPTDNIDLTYSGYANYYDTSMRAATRSSAKALILNAFIINDPNVDNSYRRNFYVSLESEWESKGIQTTVDEDVTIADMKALNQGGNDIIIFAMHGGHKENSYSLCLNERATSDTDEAYQYELRSRHTAYERWASKNGISYYRSYGIKPQFFTDSYSSNALQNKLIFSESCMFFGCDDGSDSKRPDHTLANAFKQLSAGAVVGYHNSVGANYSRDVMKLTIEEAFGGKTISEALSTAKRIHGANDNWQDDQEDKWIAYPVISNGDGQFMLVGTGIASGTVKDVSNNQAISNALIRVYTTTGTLVKSYRTSSDGNYSIEMPAGDYVIKVTAGHYKSAKMAVTITGNTTTYTETFLLLDSGLTLGYANGRITSAIASDQGVADVTIRMRLGWNNRQGHVLHSTTTNENGYYEISFLPGIYTIEYAKSGYVTGYRNIVIGPLDLAAQNAIISPITSEDEYRIVLSWRDHPSDLDSHLTGPLADGGRFHMYFPYADANEGSPYPEYVKLDLDNTTIETRPDPETITILKQLSGKYVYSVHDFSNGGDASSLKMSTSNAVVTVYKGSTLVATYNIPTGIAGTIWTVFELEGDKLTPINRFGNGYADDSSFDPYAEARLALFEENYDKSNFKP